MLQITAGLASNAVEMGGAEGTERSAARQRLAPARGILLGLGISAVFWAGLAYTVFG